MRSSDSQRWSPALPDGPPPPGVIDVWRVRLGDVPDSPEEMAAVLSAHDLEQAARRRTKDLRRRLMARRWARRFILGRVLDVEPASLRFEFGPWGKPFLSGYRGAVEFNAASSGDECLLAISAGTEVGVDIELVRAAHADIATAREFMTPDELGAFDALSGADRVQAFFRCWTRKEAFLKCDGRGLTLDPKGEEVGVTGAPRVAGGHVEIVDLGGVEGSSAAVAVRGGVGTCRMRLFKADKS